jgi:hypothetical protein
MVPRIAASGIPPSPRSWMAAAEQATIDATESMIVPSQSKIRRR